PREKRWKVRKVPRLEPAPARQPSCTVRRAVIEQEPGAPGGDGRQPEGRDGNGLLRRDFLKRSAVAGGAFAGALALPTLVRAAYGDPIPIPHPERSAANSVVLLGIVMYAFSFLPVGSNPDPQLLAQVLEGLAKSGLPSCKGEPAPFVLPNATDTLASVARPPASAPPVTKLLAEFVAGIRYEHIPPGTVASA